MELSFASIAQKGKGCGKGAGVGGNQLQSNLPRLTA
jgi:hypothetical protein